MHEWYLNQIIQEITTEVQGQRVFLKFFTWICVFLLPFVICEVLKKEDFDSIGWLFLTSLRPKTYTRTWHVTIARKMRPR